jgi:hypothetical protein
MKIVNFFKTEIFILKSYKKNYNKKSNFLISFFLYRGFFIYFKFVTSGFFFFFFSFRFFLKVSVFYFILLRIVLLLGNIDNFL